MKIVYICPSSTMYGDNIALLKLIPYLHRKGVIPFFVLPNKRRGDFVNVLKDLGYKYKSYNVFYSNCWNNGVFGKIKTLIHHLLPQRKDYKLMMKDIKNFDPDIIHTNCSACNIGYKISKNLKIEHIWHIREYLDLDAGLHYFPTKSIFIRKITSNLNHCICITEDIFKHFNHPSTGRVIYDGVFDKEVGMPINEKDDGYFLFVGRLAPAKGIDIIIKTFLRYSEKIETPKRLKIAGTGSNKYTIYLKKIVQMHPNGHLVDFLGYRTDVYALMSKAKALIVASRFEAFGFISAEAMFCGCPVIGHNVGGTKMQFDNGVRYKGCEIGFRYKTENELENYMKVLSEQNRMNLMPMLVKAQETVIHYYSAKKNADLVLQFYKNILEAKHILK